MNNFIRNLISVYMAHMEGNAVSDGICESLFDGETVILNKRTYWFDSVENKLCYRDLSSRSTGQVYCYQFGIHKSVTFRGIR